VEEIAQAAGVGKKTIYDHIGDKAELFCIVYGTPSWLDGQGQFHLPRGKRSTREVLRSLARQVVAYALSPESIALERALTMENARFPELARQVIGHAKTVFRRRLSEALEEMVRLRLLPPADTARAAVYFFEIIAANDAFKAVLGYLDEPLGAAELDNRIDMFLYGYVGRKRSIEAPRRS
jgi:AcrR family transcriptional regulator